MKIKKGLKHFEDFGRMVDPLTIIPREKKNMGKCHQKKIPMTRVFEVDGFLSVTLI